MAARDDSVIRGTMITSLIVLLFSLVGNFFLYRWGSTSSIEAARAREQLTSTQNDLRSSNDRLTMLKAMLGVGTISEAQFDVLRQGAGSDPDMQAIEERFVQDMAYLGPDVEPENRNYPALPEYLLGALRSRNDQYGQARQEATTIRAQAASDVRNARTAEEEAKRNRDAAIAQRQAEAEEFIAAREKLTTEGERTRDSLTKSSRDLDTARQTAQGEKSQYESELAKARALIEAQRQELTRLRSDRFETTQGLIDYVVPPGRLVHINLGSADALMVGVQFAVVDGNELNIEEADIKAHVQVTKILGEHSAQARVIGEPSYRNPLVRGDQLYSPFWAPGRSVRIALAGDIDLNGDGRSDVSQLKSMIEMAGAEVAAVIAANGTALEGQLDASVRFLVISEMPSTEGEGELAQANRAAVAELGRLRNQATELGITIIPAWKLLEYLKGINDSITTPLGAGARGADFAPEPAPGAARRNQPTPGLPEIFRNQVQQLEGQRRGVTRP